MSDLTNRNIYLSNIAWRAAQRVCRKRKSSVAQLLRELLDRFLGTPSVTVKMGNPRNPRIYPTNAAKQKTYRERIKARSVGQRG
jgi:hypothetical protein